jgi:plasmid maintenance system antidote protein VapI
MNFDWSSPDYISLVNRLLGIRNERRPRGAIKAFAEKLRCHPTFIAQVLKGRAHFSPEQALDVCEHFGFSVAQQDFFLNLVARDRAGTEKLKKIYQGKIDDLLEARRDLKPETGGTQKLGSPLEAEYFGNWMYQFIHAMIQIPGFQNPSSISKELSRPHSEIIAVLKRLKELGLARNSGSLWTSTLTSIHLPKTSEYSRYLHTTWKAKILSDLHSQTRLSGTHFSGVITGTEKDFQRVREILAGALKDIRKAVEPSPAENLYVLSMDCYRPLAK